MKKKILSLVLALSMVTSLMIPSVFAGYGGFLSLNRGAVDTVVNNPFELMASTDLSIESSQVYFEWTSSNPSVAYIDGRSSDYGLTSVELVPQRIGDCTITCRASFDTGEESGSDSATCSVHVEGSSGTITSVQIDPDATVYLNGSGSSTYYITASVSTSGEVDYSEISYDWSSSNSSIARVRGSGSSATISAVDGGSCIVTCTATYNGDSVKSNSCYVNVMGSSEPETPPAPSIVSNLPSSYSTTYGTKDYISIEAYSSTNDLRYEWYVDGRYYDYATGRNNQSVSFNTKNLSIGTHSVYCNVQAYYNGQYSDVTSSRTCTVYVSDSGSFYITSDLPSSYSTTYGDSNTISFNLKNTTSYGETYQWYVDGSRDNSSSGSSFNTRYLSTGTHKVYCNVYTKKADYDVTTRTCTVTVSAAGSLYISSNLPTSYSTTYGTSNTLSFNVSNSTGYSLSYQWYVDGSKNNSYGTSNTFNTKNLSTGTHKVYCYVSTSKGNYSTTTNTCTITVSSGTTTTGSMNNFKVRYSYNNRFSDVYTTNWFYSYVKTAYEYGLVNGKSNSSGVATTYCPFDNFTVAEALKIAACIHCIYYTGSESSLTSATTSPYWYSVYVNYCVSSGIINQGDFTNYNANCTRAQMAYIFSRCLPASELTAVRNVNIPDCNNTQTQYYANIQTLYNAGIVSGDQTHCYYPTQYIKRSEVAKIVCTLTAPSTRDRSTF